MAKIRILSESVSNAIAAGEVVENPTSMIKELLENSLDSGAKNIKIEVKDAGRHVIISDDGSGMTKEDLLLSIERHATSKISTKEDLFNIRSYGFRGEALSSIVSISRASISSREINSEIGNAITVLAGKVTSLKEIQRNIGTTIEIKDLFFNTPARLKFLRKSSTEYMNIKDVVIREALANPEVRISLTLDHKESVKTSGKGLDNAIVEIFGPGALKNTTKFSLGYLGNSYLYRSNRDSIFVYVNGRFVKSKIIETAVLDAYYTKLMKGKYPFAIIFVEVDPGEIDVNVHPSKKIVKFSKQGEIYDLVKKEIDTVFFRNENFVSPAIDFNQNEKTQENYYSENSGNKFLAEDEFKFETIKTETIKLDGIEKEINKNESDIFFKQSKEASDLNMEVSDKESYYNDTLNNIVEDREELKDFNTLESAVEIGNKDSVSSEHKFRIIGQVFDTFVLVERNGIFEIYDQHIIHERILYEELKEKYLKKDMNSQSLLVPIRVSLDPRDKELVFNNIDSFKFFGFEIDDFGKNELVIRSVPMIKFNESISEILKEIIMNLKENKDIDVRESMVISMSCKGAIKANQKLGHEEMYLLVKRLHEIGEYTCPHGRPIIAKISFNELEKLFKRK